MNLIERCHDCKQQHTLGDPAAAVRGWQDWQYKHAGHKVDLISEEGDGAGYAHNANVNISYIASATITITLASLASSSTFVAGQESAAQDNGSNKYVDGILRGKITVGTSPTANTKILVYVFAALDDTPTWPDVFDGTDSAETLTSVGVGDGFLKLAAMINVDSTTSDRTYPFTAMKSLAELFGFMPQDWGVFVTHNTGVNLNSTAGNHFIKVDQAIFTVA